MQAPIAMRTLRCIIGNRQVAVYGHPAMQLFVRADRHERRNGSEAISMRSTQSTGVTNSGGSRAQVVTVRKHR